MSLSNSFEASPYDFVKLKKGEKTKSAKNTKRNAFYTFCPAASALSLKNLGKTFLLKQSFLWNNQYVMTRENTEVDM